jgi:hypothetical protein
VRKIIIIHDTVADDIMGQPIVFANDAPAVRFFIDCLTHPEGQMRKHPEDYNLVQIATLGDNLEVTPAPYLILSGKSWLATTQLEEATK